MSFVRDCVKDAAIGIGISETPEGLATIHQPGCAAAIWRRDPAPAFQSWIDGLSPEHLPQSRVILRPDMVRDALGHICAAAGTPDCPERTMLIDDATALAQVFTDLMAARYLRLRLDVVTTSCCPNVLRMAETRRCNEQNCRFTWEIRVRNQ